MARLKYKKCAPGKNLPRVMNVVAVDNCARMCLHLIYNIINVRNHSILVECDPTVCLAELIQMK